MLGAYSTDSGLVVKAHIFFNEAVEWQRRRPVSNRCRSAAVQFRPQRQQKLRSSRPVTAASTTDSQRAARTTGALGEQKPRFTPRPQKLLPRLVSDSLQTQPGSRSGMRGSTSLPSVTGIWGPMLSDSISTSARSQKITARQRLAEKHLQCSECGVYRL